MSGISYDDLSALFAIAAGEKFVTLTKMVYLDGAKLADTYSYNRC